RPALDHRYEVGDAASARRARLGVLAAALDHQPHDRGEAHGEGEERQDFGDCGVHGWLLHCGAIVRHALRHCQACLTVKSCETVTWVTDGMGLGAGVLWSTETFLPISTSTTCLPRQATACRSIRGSGPTC